MLKRLSPKIKPYFDYEVVVGRCHFFGQFGHHSFEWSPTFQMVKRLSLNAYIHGFVKKKCVWHVVLLLYYSILFLFKNKLNNRYIVSRKEILLHIHIIISGERRQLEKQLALFFSTLKFRETDKIYNILVILPIANEKTAKS